MNVLKMIITEQMFTVKGALARDAELRRAALYVNREIASRARDDKALREFALTKLSRGLAMTQKAQIYRGLRVTIPRRLLKQRPAWL